MSQVQTIHKHRQCARCGLAWSHVADGKVHVHTCKDGVRALACSVRAPSMAGAIGAAGSSGGRTGGMVDVITDGMRGGVDAIGGVVDGILKPISGIVRSIDRAGMLGAVVVGGYVYLQLRPTRVQIVGDSTRRARRASTSRRRRR